jgi:hypothetical protein
LTWTTTTRPRPSPAVSFQSFFDPQVPRMWYLPLGFHRTGIKWHVKSLKMPKIRTGTWRFERCRRFAGT